MRQQKAFNTIFSGKVGKGKNTLAFFQYITLRIICINHNPKWSEEKEFKQKELSKKCDHYHNIVVGIKTY